MVTSGSEILQGRSLQVARGLGTIAARIATNGDLLHKYNIEITDGNGKMRSTYDILGELASKWDRLEESQQQEIGQAIAGQNQFKVLAAVMKNFQTAIDAVDVSLEADGSAMRENAKFMESFEAKVNLLKANFQDLANNVITGELVNGALAALNGALQFLNTGFGTTLTQITLFSGVIFGLINKLSAMKIIGVIGGQFRNLVEAIQLTAGGAGTLIESFGAVGGVMGTLAPIVLAVVAAVALLAKGYKALKDSQDYDLQLSKLEEIKSEYETQKARMEELEALNGNLTSKEKEELEILKQQTAELERQKENQQEKTDKALLKEIEQARTGTEHNVGGAAFGGDGSAVKYDKVEREFLNLAEMAQLNRQNTDEYREAVNDFIATWGDYADKAAEVADRGGELDDSVWGLIACVSMARAELEELNETSDEVVDDTDEASNTLDEYAQKFEGLPDKIQSATEALQKFKDATSVDYSAPINEYQSVFKDLSEKITSGTANMDEIRAAVDLYLPEGTLEDLHYDLEAAAERLGQEFSGNLGTVLSASDPIGGLVQVIQQGNGILQTESGVTAAYIDKNNQLVIESYALLAEALGSTEDFAKSLGLAIQNQSTQYFFTQQELSNMAEALASVGIDSTNAQSNLSTLIQTISEVGNTADPVMIQAWVDALQEVNGVDANVQITAEGVDEALNGADDVGEAVEGIPEQKSTTITAIVKNLPDVKSLASAIQGINSRTATIQANVKLTVNGQPVSLAEYKALHLAKGTDYSMGGLALVNDGVPVNGSSAELIVEGNTARIANGGEIGITHLERGAKVYTAAETQQILKNSQNDKTGLGALLTGIQAFASGTSHFDVGNYITTPPASNYNPALSGTADISTSNSKKMKEEFDKWLKEKKHYLAMDMITEAEYYRDLEIMNEKYLKDREEYLDEYWQHQEEIYEYQKKGLQDIIQLEEKLNNLAKAKTQKVLVYKNGMFQYIQNTEAIAKAQREVTGYANGTTHATAGVHLVGEKGAELRVLGEGDGIVPANLTKNLMRLGRMAGGNFGSSGGDEINNFNIGTVKLEKVNDVDGLFSGLKNLAMQTATARA